MARWSLVWFLVQFFLYSGIVYFYHVFLEDKDKNEFIRTIISAVINYAFTILLIFVCDSDIVASLIQAIVIILGLLVIRKASLKKVIISFVLCMTIEGVSEVFALLVEMILSNFVEVDESSVYGLLLITYSIFFFLISFVLGKIYKKKDVDLSSNIYFIAILLIVGQFLTLNWLTNYLNVDIMIPSRYGTLFIFLLQIIIMCLVVALIRNYITFEKEKYSIELIQNDREKLEEQLLHLKENQTVLNDIRKEIQEKDLSIYEIERLSNDLKNIRTQLYSDDPSVNALLSYFKQSCDTENIKLDIDIKGKVKDELSGYDFNILLSNLLKNAIEATNSYISLKVVNNGNNIFIQCMNTIDYKIKKKKLIHGQGVPIIKDIIQKYNGIYDATIQEENYVSSITLKSN